jgi:hypothetical protein
MAITSLVFGILSLLCLSLLGAIPAVILGHKARGRIRNSGGTLGGAGLALGGLITGYLSLVLFLVSIPILIMAYGQFKQQAIATICIGNLQQIEFAKEQWAMEAEPADDEVPSTEALNGFLDQKIEDMKCPSGGTYKINAAKVKPTCSVPGHELKE